MNKTLLFYLILFALLIYYQKDVRLDNFVYLNTIVYCVYHYTETRLDDFAGFMLLLALSKSMIKIPFEEYIFVCTFVNAATKILLDM